ncbi:hypothetical protein AXF42_Ash012042 [Apostasia shenzhenica]|uniref:Uncharacterized protein n=1 Tax=Apostasia shenzhenica TaxID=1088818 RepID=A0A2I0AJN0_9ASPA|nr:hypothetical protein AXF42_Ash012042 [Apostasia shenzhenica]
MFGYPHLPVTSDMILNSIPLNVGFDTSQHPSQHRTRNCRLRLSLSEHHVSIATNSADSHQSHQPKTRMLQPLLAVSLEADSVGAAVSLEANSVEAGMGSTEVFNIPFWRIR